MPSVDGSSVLTIKGNKPALFHISHVKNFETQAKSNTKALNRLIKALKSLPKLIPE